ncbi:MAG: hypothetical protein B1H13_13405 [Desulfobacteraceae bacterium 4484_190.3]|nr:MAG: hypothetical protein B1H13_13405 [Desulfobacteraceae bacterium 4484_190.3]
MSYLGPLDLKGKAVTAVAMHTQRKLARFLVEDKHADYYFTVKDNQRPLHNVPFFNQPTLKEDIGALKIEITMSGTLRMMRIVLRCALNPAPA